MPLIPCYFIFNLEYTVPPTNMSCFAGCMPRPQPYNHLQNRMTNLPVKFDRNELDELRKKFNKVSLGRQEITKEAFKKNMGILGLHCAQQFSERLFNSFDIDNDGKISFHDFVEYMEVLKCGNDQNKARISFKLIAQKNSSKISVKEFKQFLNDFFLSWSSITNISITSEIKERTNQYVNFIFAKVKKQTGKEEIDYKYYQQKLYKDKDFIESFQFITQGMANIFISDKLSDSEKDPSVVLYKVLKELARINDTIFEMTNDQSYNYETVHMEEVPRDIPFFPPQVFGKLNKFRDTQKNPPQKAVNPHLQKDANFYNKNNNQSRSTSHPAWKVKNQDHETNTQQNTNYFNDSRSKHSYWNESSAAEHSNKLAMLQKKLNFLKESVREIIKDTRGIFEVLREKFEEKQDEYQKGKTGTIKNVHKRIKRTEGNMIFIGDDNWNLVLNMMIGIQMAVRSVKGFQEMIYEEPKDFGLKYYFELIPRRFGDQDNNSTIYSFTDYAPNTFNHIRKIFNIDNEEYIGSIGPNRLMASLMMGEVNSMTSLTSQGKSGSFFYYTADGKYMLKTIQYREYKFLRSILQSYYYYLKKNTDTMITKFYGLHKLIEKNIKGNQICRSYFVIMANVFNTKEKILERYDIKGSWYGRETSDKDPMATKKDNDFKQRPPIFLDEEERVRLMTIIQKDAEFFAQHQIIDYSLLIGVIRKSESMDSDFRNSASMFNKDEEDLNRQTKAYISMENNESYIFGIIDILTLYDSRKVMEYYFKRIFYGEGISAVPPPDYANRFIDFIGTNVFPVKKLQKTRSNYLQIER